LRFWWWRRPRSRLPRSPTPRSPTSSVTTAARGRPARIQALLRGPVIVDPDDQIQVAIADRDPGTGVGGLEYSLDQTWTASARSANLLTAVDGERWRRVLASRGSTTKKRNTGSPPRRFSVPASVIGDPARFDFYVFIQDGQLDEAVARALRGLASSIYPKDGRRWRGISDRDVPRQPDVTLSERPILHRRDCGFVLVVGGLSRSAAGACAPEKGSTVP
jgi:hypothetical protein